MNAVLDAAAASSSQKGRLLVDTTYESAGMSTDVGKPADGSTSDTDIASDWSEVASRQSQAPRATQVIFSQMTSVVIFMLLLHGRYFYGTF